MFPRSVGRSPRTRQVIGAAKDQISNHLFGGYSSMFGIQPFLSSLLGRGYATQRENWPKSRPKFRKGFLDNLWASAKDKLGRVFDPNSGRQLHWNKDVPRKGQWDAGHKPCHEYKDLVSDLDKGLISKKEFSDIYHNPNNYQPEEISANRSRKYQGNK